METGQTSAPSTNIDGPALLSEAPGRQLESRSTQRTNLFVAAVLYSEDGNCAVKVRNLSESGVLVEASTLPPVGTAVRLCRGSLGVCGRIIWQRAGKAGLRLTSTITVADWLPNNKSRHQSHVDELIHRMKAEEETDSSNPSSSRLESEAPTIPQQVSAIAAGVERLANELAADPYVIANHSWKLQQLEGVVQQLRKIVAVESLKV